MLKRHEVEILLKAGHPKTEVARLAGVSLRQPDCSIKGKVKKKHISNGQSFSRFAAHVIERDLF